MSYLDIRRAHIEAGRPLKEKKKYQIPKVSAKRKAKQEAEKAKGSDTEMDRFFTAMLKRCTGKCLFCGGSTTAVANNFWRDDNPDWSQEANDKKHERFIETMRRASVAHLLPKRPVAKGGFPSIGTHEDNWIELCWNCHTNFDKGKPSWLMLKDSKEWDIIQEKLFTLLPLITEEERKNKLYPQLQELVYGKK